MTPSKKSYLRRLGYTEQRIAELEQQEPGSKAKSSLEELVYKAIADGSPAKPNAITELVAAKLTKDKPAGSPTPSPLVNRLMAGQPLG